MEWIYYSKAEKSAQVLDVLLHHPDGERILEILRLALDDVYEQGIEDAR